MLQFILSVNYETPINQIQEDTFLQVDRIFSWICIKQ